MPAWLTIAVEAAGALWNVIADAIAHRHATEEESALRLKTVLADSLQKTEEHLAELAAARAAADAVIAAGGPGA